MNIMKTALVLVVLALFHPGFALFTVGIGTLVIALQLAVEWSTADEGMVPVVELQGEKAPRGD